MANDRDCENCIHKVNGACNVWECKFEPKEDEPFEPREDAISRQAVIQHICENKSCYEENCKGVLFNRCMDITWVNELPSVNPQKPNINEVLAKIRAEIDEQYDRVHPYDISCAEGLEMALNIVDKYIAEEDKA